MRGVCRAGKAVSWLAVAMLVVVATPLLAAELTRPGQGSLPSLTPVPLPSGQPVFEIPPVFQRPLGVEQGARVFVRGFRLTGVVDDPEAGISAGEAQARAQARFDELMALLEKLRLERQNQTEVGEHGFTPEEQQRILKFMQDVVSQLSPDRQQQAYQEFIDQLRIEKLQRDQGLTIGQLQQVADAVTGYYREQGFFLARAIIPAQEVVGGIVNIQVLEGRLGNVLIEGNDSYATDTLRAPFEDLIGELITVDAIENALLTVKAYPGINAFGVFQPGTQPGAADIVVRVQDERAWDASARADNHGTVFTGEQRLLGEFNWNNPFGGADQLGATVLQTFKPDNSLYGALRYERALPDPSYRWGVELSQSTFAVANLSSLSAGNEISGVAQIGKLSLEKYFQRSRTTSVWGTADLSRKRADTESGDLIINRDDLASLGLELAFERIDAASASIATGFIRFDQGLDGALGVPGADEVDALEPPPSRGAPALDGTGFDYASSDFSKLSFGYSRLKSLSATQTLLLRVNGQYSNDMLTSLEQFVMGGPNSVRAIPTAQFLTDSGYFASLEYRVQAPFFSDAPAFGGHTWGQVLGFSIFVDHAVGLVNRPLFNQPDRLQATGSGVGIHFSLPGTFDLNIQAARLNGGPRPPRNIFDVSAIEDDTQFWVDFTWHFN